MALLVLFGGLLIGGVWVSLFVWFLFVLFLLLLLYVVVRWRGLGCCFVFLCFSRGERVMFVFLLLLLLLCFLCLSG